MDSFRLLIKPEAWCLLQVYQIFFAPDYEVNFGRDIHVPIKNVILNPGPKTVQIPFMDIDQAKPSVYNRKRRDTLA